MAARAKANEKGPKAPKKAKAPAKAQPQGGGMFRLLFFLAIVGGIGYAAMRVPIGGKTAFAHAAELLQSDVLAKKAGEVGRGAKDVISRVTEGSKEKEKAPEKAPAKAAEKAPEKAKAPEKQAAKAPAKVADARSGRPAEKLTRDDRDALDKLVR